MPLRQAAVHLAVTGVGLMRTPQSSTDTAVAHGDAGPSPIDLDHRYVRANG